MLSVIIERILNLNDIEIMKKDRKVSKMEDKNQKLPSTRIQWYPGHMAKAKRILEEDLKLIDIVIEVIDARIPISSRNPDIDKIIKNKKRIILLNKSDLANEEETIKWRNKLIQSNDSAIIASALDNKKNNEILREIEKIIKEKKEKESTKGRIGRITRIMVLGIPNVGKSSIINRLSGKKSLDVKNKPGVTVKKQWIRISNNIELMDTPGILWPKFENNEIANNLAFTGTIKNDILDNVEIAFNLLKILLEKHRINLIRTYKLNEEEINRILENSEQQPNEKIMDVMRLIGRKRGVLISGGNIDENKMAEILLKDFRKAKIGRITLEVI